MNPQKAQNEMKYLGHAHPGRTGVAALLMRPSLCWTPETAARNECGPGYPAPSNPEVLYASPRAVRQPTSDEGPVHHYHPQLIGHTNMYMTPDARQPVVGVQCEPHNPPITVNGVSLVSTMAPERPCKRKQFDTALATSVEDADVESQVKQNLEEHFDATLAEAQECKRSRGCSSSTSGSKGGLSVLDFFGKKHQ